ncbi:MAG: hypothetical protein CUN53_12600 [Phototrophicales bacterium]|nr:MAG: hypothetical protein CUN53_12600 [Phototrophicales bacterium]
MMTPPRRLVDSGFLYALFDESAPQHHSARQVLDAQQATYFIPEVTLTEAAYLIRRSGGVDASLRFLDALIAFPKTFISILPQDMLRVREIMRSYTSARFDFVDCCIMALAERLEINSICTFDRRDFSIFRPIHIDHFDLLPHHPQGQTS